LIVRSNEQRPYLSNNEGDNFHLILASFRAYTLEQQRHRAMNFATWAKQALGLPDETSTTFLQRTQRLCFIRALARCAGLVVNIPLFRRYFSMSEWSLIVGTRIAQASSRELQDFIKVYVLVFSDDTEYVRDVDITPLRAFVEVNKQTKSKAYSKMRLTRFFFLTRDDLSELVSKDKSQDGTPEVWKEDIQEYVPLTVLISC
jgi:hypothetical protein